MNKAEVAVTTALAATLATPVLAQTSGEQQPQMTIDEIIVTARRRSESLMDIPMSHSLGTSTGQFAAQSPHDVQLSFT